MDKRILGAIAGVAVIIVIVVTGIMNMVNGGVNNPGSSYDPGTSKTPGSQVTPQSTTPPTLAPAASPTPATTPAESSDSMGDTTAGTDFATTVVAAYVRYQTSEPSSSRAMRLAQYFSDQSQIPVGDFTPSVYETSGTTTDVKYGGVKAVSVVIDPKDASKWNVTIMAAYAMTLTYVDGSVSYRIGQAPYTVTIPANFVAGQLASGFTDPRIP